MSIEKKIRITEKGYGRAILSHDVKSHANDPFILEKVEKAKEFIKKVKLPREKSE
ncbi:hypothetical protein [Mucilaginibacter sp. SJ]|uniref:hypothetical protein n=1 Tax=Mucilaginibacter sp. SJ TaxID=3029053 RepID=UPI0023A9958F|nr:hypothetical protein [Mucilaginibacter sp. SJ]WEA03773.1 hypothetical protein MusilaSJ_12595 [Mucilaginibacter sp. SJ]